MDVSLLPPLSPPNTQTHTWDFLSPGRIRTEPALLGKNRIVPVWIVMVQEESAVHYIVHFPLQQHRQIGDLDFHSHSVRLVPARAHGPEMCSIKPSLYTVYCSMIY